MAMADSHAISRSWRMWSTAICWPPTRRGFNVANGRSTSLLSLLSQLNRLLGTTIEPIHAPPRAGDIRESLADISAAREVLGYEPQVDFEEGLKRSVGYYRELVAGKR